MNSGTFTTSRVEVEKVPLKRGISMRSTLFDVFSSILWHTEESDEARQSNIVKESFGRYVSTAGLEAYPDFLRVNQLARSAVEKTLKVYF